MTVTAVFSATLVPPEPDEKGGVVIDADFDDSAVRAEIPVGTETLTIRGRTCSVSVGDAAGLVGMTVTVSVQETINPSEVSGTAYEFIFE